jgi:predicted nucleic acid-binding protein
MIVVADSSPLHYLILVGEADLLRQLYGDVTVPDAVAAELTRPASPPIVATWVSAPPSWVTVKTVAPEEIASIPETLDLGERAAIALAETMRADLLLIDETAGRTEARRRHIRVTGTLGVLRAAAEMNLVEVPDLLIRLEATNFYVDEALLRTVFAPWLES